MRDLGQVNRGSISPALLPGCRAAGERDEPRPATGPSFSPLPGGDELRCALWRLIHVLSALLILPSTTRFEHRVARRQGAEQLTAARRFCSAAQAS